MFENLKKIWSRDDYITKLMSEFKEMLEDASEIFIDVCEMLVEHQEKPTLEDEVFDLDKRINQLEKDIRKKIVLHISVQPEKDATANLLFMSVVKDAERIGDYGKNLYGIKHILAKPIDKDLYQNYFGDMDKKIINMFEGTKKAFLEYDREKAVESWKIEREVTKLCDNIVEKIAKSDLDTNTAVAYTLIARYYKRIAAHLTNIATSVILPIDDLDYYDEKRKKEIN